VRATAAAPAAAEPGALLTRLAAEPDACQPSGQPASGALCEALAGSPSPLGATYLPDRVRHGYGIDFSRKASQVLYSRPCCYAISPPP